MIEPGILPRSLLLAGVLVAVPLACSSEPATGDAGKGAAGGTAGGGPYAGCPEDGFPSTGCLPSQEGDVCGWGDGYGAICPCDMSCGGIICECTGDYWNCSYWDDWGVPCGGGGGTGGTAGNGGGFGAGGA